MKIYNSISTKTFTAYVFLILIIKTTIITISVSAQTFSCAPPPPPIQYTNKDVHVVGVIPNIFVDPHFKPPDANGIDWNAYTDIIYETTSLLPTILKAPPTVGTGNLSPTSYPDDPYLINLTELAKTKDVKIFVAFGNYGANSGGIWTTLGGDQQVSTSYIDSIAYYVNNRQIYGINIEYPKCGVKNGNAKEIKDTRELFVKMVKQIKEKLQDKFITVTVGPTDPLDIAKNLNGIVEWVNVIGYRLNIGVINGREGKKEGPTSPFDNAPGDKTFLTFKDVANNWNTISQTKIVMGIEFSGIIRKAKSNLEDLKKSQAIESVKGPLGFTPGKGKEIYSCDPPNTYEHMQSILWSGLKPTILADDCNTTDGWERVFDEPTKSTFLYLQGQDQGQGQDDTINFYISYEDSQSLQYKVDFIIKQQNFSGIMISDISADPKNELLPIVASIRNQPDPQPTNTTTPPNTSTGGSSSSTGNTPSTSASPSDTSATASNTNNNTGLIIGAVFGAFSGVAAIIGLSLFYIGYKRREQMSLNKSVNSNDYQNVSVPVSIIDKAVPATPVSRVTALYDFEGKETTDLSFKKGDIIEVIEKGDGANDWWVGKIGSKIGEFPGNYVRE